MKIAVVKVGERVVVRGVAVEAAVVEEESVEIVGDGGRNGIGAGRGEEEGRWKMQDGVRDEEEREKRGGRNQREVNVSRQKEIKILDELTEIIVASLITDSKTING